MAALDLLPLITETKTVRNRPKTSFFTKISKKKNRRWIYFLVHKLLKIEVLEKKLPYISIANWSYMNIVASSNF